MPLRVSALRFVQKDVPMYLVALPVKELGFCSIDHWDPQRIGNWRGYQRGLIKKKINRLAKYLERGDGILPVAGLLNVREKRTLTFKGKKSKKPTLGTLIIPDYTRLWVVDMQHRLEGIKAANQDALKDFSVPVLITEGLTTIKEAAQFYIINTQSDRMSVALTRRLLIEHEEIKDLVDVPPWELKAVQIAIRLNQKIEGNPWYRRIREPESPGLRDQVATEKSFVPSLKWLLNSPQIGGKSAAHLAKFLANYWEGIRSNLPKAFESPRSYLIQKTPGFMALHRLAPLIYRKYSNRSPSTYRRVFSILSTHPRLGEKFWYRKNLQGAKHYGTGQAAYSQLALDLRKKLGI